jgi:hypothetical protein
MATKSITITAPISGTKFYLVSRAQKKGTTVFEETVVSSTLRYLNLIRCHDVGTVERTPVDADIVDLPGQKVGAAADGAGWCDGLQGRPFRGRLAC